MPTVRRRGKRWQVEICVNGVRRSRTGDTKSEVLRWAYSESERLKVATEHRHLHEAIDRYKEEITPLHKSARWEGIKLEKIKEEIPDKPLSELVRDDFARWKHERLQRVSNGSVRREMGILGQVLNACVNEWGWLKQNPMKGVKRPSEPPPRRRGVSQEEIDKIVQALGYIPGRPVTTKSQEVAIAFLLAIETAMRAGEILSLQISQLNLESKVLTLVDTKNGDHREVPLSLMAVKLINTISSGSPCIFSVSLASLDSLFRKAKIKAGFPDVHFHDSRSEALTRLSKKLDVLELARVVGHRDPRSLMIYYATTAEDMAKKLD